MPPLPPLLRCSLALCFLLVQRFPLPFPALSFQALFLSSLLYRIVLDLPIQH